MKSVFQVADQNRNGGICIREFNNILRELEEKPSKDDEIFLVLEDLDDYLKEHFTQGSYMFSYPNLMIICNFSSKSLNTVFRYNITI